MKKQVIVIDGYNVIGNWPDLAHLKETDHLAEARDDLLQVLANYHKYVDTEIRVIFDAMYVPGITQNYDRYGLLVTFTQQDETADTYIERLASELNNHLTQLTVVTSDQAEQWTVFSRGALRISSREFAQEIKRVEQEIQTDTDRYHRGQQFHKSTWNTSQLLMLEKVRDELGDQETKNKRPHK